ncbi:hypothetical protein AALA78_13430 [Lachnospiraceae bacterium 42-17]
MKKGWLALLLLVAVTGIVGFGLTGGKAQKVQRINQDTVRTVNPGSREQALNPLRENVYPELTEAVKEYYRQLGDVKNFIEEYGDIRVYTKSGKYTGSYIAFVRYEMKIKDIYTTVPGLGTLYIEKDGTSGEYEIRSEPDRELGEYISIVNSHEDVQELFTNTNEEYENAVESDALLKEALLDLKSAYEEQTHS